jgi:hypothetical protein
MITWFNVCGSLLIGLLGAVVYHFLITARADLRRLSRYKRMLEDAFVDNHYAIKRADMQRLWDESAEEAK